MVLRGSAQSLHLWPGRTALLPGGANARVSNVNLLAIPYYANANRQPTDMMVWLAETPLKAEPAPRDRTLPAVPTIRFALLASDSVAAMNDQLVPTASDDNKDSRFTRWDHRGLGNGCNTISSRRERFPPSRSIGGMSVASTRTAACRNLGNFQLQGRR